MPTNAMADFVRRGVFGKVTLVSTVGVGGSVYGADLLGPRHNSKIQTYKKLIQT
jgi:hypothetical protein